MNAVERLRKVESLYLDARARPLEERAAFLADACAGDAILRAQIEALLAQPDSTGRLVDPPALEPVAHSDSESGRPSLIGRRLGIYHVLALLGVGGMGEVYRSRDTRLGREVAIKVLPRAFTADPERLARFEREARVLGSLNHPNIAAIYGVEDFDPPSGSGLLSHRALVLELVEGDTLAERIRKPSQPRRSHEGSERGADQRSGLTIAEALRIARQITDALEAAHEKGVIHRDLKPANIKITPAGVVKVLDFGLAKLAPVSDADDAGASDAFTTFDGTREGVVIGTPAYMSPEQARGQAVDKRADIWAFGCVLYEMLTGRGAFVGATAQDTIAAVLNREPVWDALPKALPQTVQQLLHRCLEKDVRRRLHDVADARLELEDAIAVAPRVGPKTNDVGTPQPFWQRLMAIAATAVVLTVLGGTAVWYAISQTATPAITRFTLTVPAAGGIDLAFSADGNKLVYRVNDELFLRVMNETQPRLLSQTRGVGNSVPVFSPDGQWVAFWSTDRTLKKVALAGGAVSTICKFTSRGRDVEWHGDRLVFSDVESGNIYSVLADGGEPEVLISVKPPESAAYPQIVDAGRAVLFTLTTETGVGRSENAQTVVQTLSSGERDVIMRGASAALYLPSGHLLYAIGRRLFAVPFDLDRRRTRGAPVSIVENMLPVDQYGGRRFAFSSNGSFAYVSRDVGSTDVEVSGAFQPGILALTDRRGTIAPLRLQPAAYYHPRVSPDGRWLVVGTDDGNEAIVWVHDLKGGAPARRLTFTGRNTSPIWDRSGTRIAYQSDRDGDLAMFWQLADGTGGVERLSKPGVGIEHRPETWTADGKMLAFLQVASRGGGVGNGDIWTLSMDGDRAPKPLTGDGTSNERFTAFSPNGRWFAYTSTAIGGRMEVFVEPFPPTGAKYQISSDGGRTPFWSPDGKELFYHRRSTNGIVAVRLEQSPTFRVGAATPLPIEGAMLDGPGRNFDVTPDGQQFVIVAPTSGSKDLPYREINITLNWFEELKRLVPTK